MENNNLNDEINENINQEIINENINREIINQNNINQQMIQNNMINEQLMNDDNNNDNNKNNKSLILSLVGLVLFILIAVFAFLQFNKKDDFDNPKDDNTQEQENNQNINELDTENDLITELTKSELSNSNKEFKFSNTTVNLKKENGKLYINNSIATIQNYNGEFVEIEPSAIYKTNKYIIISVEWQSTEYPYAINENGELINIKRLTADTGQDGIHDLQLENGKVIAIQSTDGPDSIDKKVEFAYESGTMTIKYVE